MKMAVKYKHPTSGIGTWSKCALKEIQGVDFIISLNQMVTEIMFQFIKIPVHK
jgi:hypothetical protein